MRHNGCECKIAMMKKDFDELLEKFKNDEYNYRFSTFFPIYYATNDKEKIICLCGNYILDKDFSNPAIDYILNYLRKKDTYYEFIITDGKKMKVDFNKVKQPILFWNIEIDMCRQDADLHFMPDTI